jgi:uncharacterized protein (TIGR04222 family)
LIAFLRGGKNEAMRVVTMSLIDRGILVATEKSVEAARGALGMVTSALEEKVVRYFTPSGAVSSLFNLKDADPELWRYEEELTRLGLLPDQEIKSARAMRIMVALLVTLGLAGTKIVVALQTGHSNIAFLIILAVISTIVIVKVSRPRRTTTGDRMIEDLRTLFGGLKERSSAIQNGASPGEFALMAAVFGMAAVPDAKRLFPQSGGSSCGSSCGSDSGGDSGGSSCGGGGCGGCGGS